MHGFFLNVFLLINFPLVFIPEIKNIFLYYSIVELFKSITLQYVSLDIFEYFCVTIIVDFFISVQ